MYTEQCGSAVDLFVCGMERQCVPYSLTCNGVANCKNGQDESPLICGCPSDDDFQCENRHQCISVLQRCDGFPHCDDGSDEQRCEEYLCPSTHTKCDNHRCVFSHKWCDYEDDCGDGSDENPNTCAYRECYASEKQCDNKECFFSLAYYTCDGIEDCKDGSDEINCTDTNFMVCGDRRIHLKFRCDGQRDCENGEDEYNCVNCTSPEDYRCESGYCILKGNVCDGECDCKPTCDDERDCNTYTRVLDKWVCNPLTTVSCTAPFNQRCISEEYICDGIAHCQNAPTVEGNDDEYLCVAEENSTCPEGSFRCDRRCFPLAYRCNHQVNCMGATDEQDCDDVYPPCNDTDTRCSNGRCVPQSSWCDFVVDCDDASDEINCVRPKCSETDWTCDNGQCIPAYQHCDYYVDCIDASDEGSYCEYNVKPCSPDMRACMNGQCIPNEHWCLKQQDRRTGCADNSHLRDCEDWVCEPDQFKCRAFGYCLPSEQVCDGDPRGCEDISDELGCKFDCVVGDPGCECQDVGMNCTDLGLTSLPSHMYTGVKMNKIVRFNFSGNALALYDGIFEKFGPYPLTHLYLSNNNISDVGQGWFRNLTKLVILDLSNNEIGRILNSTFKGLVSVRTLDLRGNKIKELSPSAFDGLSSLLTLDLTNQQLVRVVHKTFQGLRNLQTLTLSYNLIEHIEDGAFLGLNSLIALDISHNHIVEIEDNVFNGLPFSQLKLVTDEFRFCCLAKGLSKCLPEPDQFSSCEDLMSNVVLRVCIWVLGFISLIGNAVVVIWRIRDKRDGQVHSFLITNLAIGDFLMGIYLIVIATVDVHYRGVYIIHDQFWRQSYLCQIMGFLSTLSSELSVLTLTVLTVDRLVCIVFPFRLAMLTIRSARKWMALLWVTVTLLGIVPLLPIEYFLNFYGRSGVCLALHITVDKPNGWEYSVFIFLVINFVSFCIIVVSYIWMYQAVRETRQQALRAAQMKKENAMARRMALIVLTDFCCWMPIIALGVVSLSGVPIHPQVFAWIAVFVLPFNAAINPLLYSMATVQFKTRVISIIARIRIAIGRRTNPGLYGTGSNYANYNSYTQSISINNGRGMSMRSKVPAKPTSQSKLSASSSSPLLSVTSRKVTTPSNSSPTRKPNSTYEVLLARRTTGDMKKHPSSGELKRHLLFVKDAENIDLNRTLSTNSSSQDLAGNESPELKNKYISKTEKQNNYCEADENVNASNSDEIPIGTNKTDKLLCSDDVSTDNNEFTIIHDSGVAKFDCIVNCDDI